MSQPALRVNLPVFLLCLVLGGCGPRFGAPPATVQCPFHDLPCELQKIDTSYDIRTIEYRCPHGCEVEHMQFHGRSELDDARRAEPEAAESK